MLDFVYTSVLQIVMTEQQKKTRNPLESSMLIRVSEREKVAFEQAAITAGMNLSQWVRYVCNAAIKRMKK